MGSPTLLPPEPPVPVTGYKAAEAMLAPWGSCCSHPCWAGPETQLLLSFSPPGDFVPSLALCFSFRLPAMRTVYCMNEAEIVDVALGILIEVKSAVSFLMTRNSWWAETRPGPGSC